MKFKKAVGALSALAITVSAFAGMAVTANAAEITDNYESDTSVINFEKIAGRGSGGVELGSGDNTTSVYKLSAASNEQNAVPGLHLISTVDNSITKIAFDCSMSNYASIVLGNSDQYIPEAQSSSVKGNDVSASVSIGTAFSFGTTRQKVSGTNSNCYDVNNGQSLDGSLFKSNSWYHIEATIDNDNKTVTYTISPFNSDDVLKSGTVDFIDKDTLYVNSIIMRTGNNSATVSIDNVSIETSEEEVQYCNVTINKNLRSAEGIIESLTENVYVEANTSYTYSYERYIMNNGIIYEYSGDTDDYVIQNVESDTTMDLSYDELSDGVFFAEAENIGMNGTENSSCSGGMYSAMAGANSMGSAYELVTLPAGKYRVTVDLVERSDRGLKLRDASKSLEYGVDSDVVADIVNSGSNIGTCVVDFSLDTETTLKLTGVTTSNNRLNQSAGFDYILITKTGDITPPEPSEPSVNKAVTKVSESTDLEGNEAVSYMAKFDITGSYEVKGVIWTVNGAGEYSESEPKTVEKVFENSTTITDGSIVFGLAIEAENGIDTIGTVDAELK